MRLVPTLLAGLVVLSGCAATPAPAPAGSTVEHAENFSLRYEDGYQVLTVNEPSPGAAPESYVLVSCGATPDLLPITSLFSASTTHLPLLVDLGRLDVLASPPRPTSAPRRCAPSWTRAPSPSSRPSSRSTSSAWSPRPPTS